MTQQTHLKLLAMIPVCCLLGGCAAPLVGALTLNHLLTLASAATTFTSGKGIGEIALDGVTGRDCRLLEGVLRSDRDVCENRGSFATEQDFKGLATVVAFIGRRVNGDGTSELAQADAPVVEAATPGASAGTSRRDDLDSLGGMRLALSR